MQRNGFFARRTLSPPQAMGGMDEEAFEGDDDMNHIDAMKKMVAALETCVDGDYSTGHVIHPSFDEKAVDEAIAAGRAAIAEAERKEQCPASETMGEHACKNKAQCWEPCGDLG